MCGWQLDELHPCTFVLSKVPVFEPEHNVLLKVKRTWCVSLKISQHRSSPLFVGNPLGNLIINAEELFKRVCSHLLNLPQQQKIHRNSDSAELRGAHKYLLFTVTHFSLSSTFVASCLCSYLNLKLIYSLTRRLLKTDWKPTAKCVKSHSQK